MCQFENAGRIFLPRPDAACRNLQTKAVEARIKTAALELGCGAVTDILETLVASAHGLDQPGRLAMMLGAFLLVAGARERTRRRQGARAKAPTHTSVHFTTIRERSYDPPCLSVRMPAPERSPLST